MEESFTLDELADFIQNERQLLAELGMDDLEQDEQSDIQLSPRKHVIDNILNYSRALSVRPSKLIGHIEIVNN